MRFAYCALRRMMVRQDAPYEKAATVQNALIGAIRFAIAPYGPAILFYRCLSSFRAGHITICFLE